VRKPGLRTALLYRRAKTTERSPTSVLALPCDPLASAVETHVDAAALAALSATVCGPDLAFADAFATGLLAAGAAGFDAITGAGYEALIVTPEHVAMHTDAFPFSR